MTATTHPEYNSQTEALTVTAAFPDSIRGKTILVTGVNRNGIGYTTAEAFASQSPAHLILAGHSPPKVQECIAELGGKYPSVDYRFLELDLASQASVRSAASTLLSDDTLPVIDIIVNSAGVMNVPTRMLSPEGIELHFATNHIGHFLLTCLLTPKLIAAASQPGVPKGATRVINVTSLSSTRSGIRWSDVNFEKTNQDLPADEQPNYDLLAAWGWPDARTTSYVPLEGYNQSKVANVLFGIALTKRLFAGHGILSLAVHPGIIMTELSRDAPPQIVPMIEESVRKGDLVLVTQEAGAAPSLVASLDPALGPPEERKDGVEKDNWGAFLVDCQISDRADARAVSGENAERLWRLSEELVGEKFEWLPT
jgi:NAD(P)-dependent dehydrogenase (short-subunit alcohol dehydrogenase family)